MYASRFVCDVCCEAKLVYFGCVMSYRWRLGAQLHRRRIKTLFNIFPAFHMLVSSSSDLTVMEIIGRIEANQDLFQRKYAKKMAAEEEYYQNRYKLQAKGGRA